MRNTFLLFLVFQLYVTLLHVLSGALLQPPPLAPRHVMWLCWLVVPLLALSNMATDLSKDVITKAEGKNDKGLSKSVRSSNCVGL